MALERWTGRSMGGPTYIPDARVQEAIAMGELLSKRQALAQDANDRLFARNQSIADAQERRRQFDAVQGRYAETAQREAADRKAAMERAILESDRSFTAGREDTAAQRAQTEAQRAQAAALADREFGLRQTAEQRAAADMAADNARADTQFAARQAAEREAADRASKERGDDVAFRERESQRAERRAQEAEAANERRFNATRTDRSAELIAERAHQKELQADDEKRRDQKIETERAKAEGTAEERRAATVAAQVARFRMALEEATAKGSLSDNDQAQAVRRALDAAKFPSVAATDIRREAVDLGPEGEAAAEAEFRRIVEEKFPKTFRLDLLGENPSAVARWGGRAAGLFTGGLGGNIVGEAANLPDYVPDRLENWLGEVSPEFLSSFFRQTSGGSAEADKLFTRQRARPDRPRGNVAR